MLHCVIPKRTGLVIVFVALTFAAIRSVPDSIPQGPWIGMYNPFLSVWLAVGLALLILLLLIQYTDVSWTSVFVVAILSAILLVNLSRLWGVPFGIRDPYRHLYLIESDIYSFDQNVYPILHLFIKTFSSVTGLSVKIALGLVGMIATTIGIGLLALVQRRLGVPKVTQQTAMIAGIPLVAVGLIARPYTLGIVFIPLFLWIITTHIHQGSIQILLLVVAFGMLWLHPVAFLVGSAVVVSAIMLRTVSEWITIPAIHPPPATAWTKNRFVVILVCAFVAHILFFSGVGSTVLDQATLESGEDTKTTPTATATPTPTLGGQSNTVSGENSGNEPDAGENTGGESDIGTPVPKYIDATIFTHIHQNFFEFVMRALVGLIFLGIAAFVAVREFYMRSFDHLTVVIGVAGTLLLGLFVVLDLLRIDMFTIRRIIVFAPLLLFPLFARILQTQRGIRIILALLVLTSGSATLYDSSAVTGGLQNGATTAQVESYRWYGEHGTASLTGSGSTFWIGRWLHGDDVMREWGNGQWPVIRWKDRDAKYPWQVTDRSDHDVVINGYERARARHEAREDGIRSAVVHLERFQNSRTRIYDNGNVRFYDSQG